jgi:hypothetical protein
MVKTVLKLAVVGLLANAAFQVVPPFYNNYKFEDALTELATFPPRRVTVQQMMDRCARLAEAHDLELRPTDFQVQLAGQGSSTARIQTAYRVEMNYIPGRQYVHTFDIKVEGGPPRFGSMTP